MDVLLSWSGKPSHELALYLREWLPEVLSGIRPWVSSEDIPKGQRWSDELHKQLDKSKVAIICITPENVRSPWLYYEAGMVAAKIGLAAVCPYLVGISGKLIQGTPLSLYQWTESDKADTLKLIRVLNDKLDTPHDPVALEDNFQTKWPQLKRRIEKVIEGYSQIEDPVETVKQPLSQILTPESIELLVAACKDSGDIMYIAYLGGTEIQAGKRNFVNQGDPRSLAHWRGALDELEQHAFIESLGHQRVIYRVTRQGWSAFDEINGTMKNGSTDVSKPLSKP